MKRWPTRQAVSKLARCTGEPLTSLYLPLPSPTTSRRENERAWADTSAEASARLSRWGVPTSARAKLVERLVAAGRQLPWQPGMVRGVAAFTDDSTLYSCKLALPPERKVCVGRVFSLRELIRQVDLLEPRTTGVRSPTGELIVQLDHILQLARRGELERLWVREGARIEGTLDSDRGRILPASENDDDVLDALAVAVLRRGGEVEIAGPDALPSHTNVAAELSRSGS